MTNTFDNNGEAILVERTYPPEWKKWLNRWYDGTVFSNQEILENRELDSEGDWFNPFTESHKLDQLRLKIDMKPKHWREYILDNFPGIDATEQYRIRRAEVGNRFRLERVAKCRMIVTLINPTTSEPYIDRLPPCKQYDICPNCAEYKIEMEEKELREFIGKARVVIVSKDDEKQMARKIKDDYRRYPMGDSQTAFVIETDEEIGEPLNYSRCKELAKYSISEVKRKVTGKLGKSEEEVEQDESDKITVKHRRMKIEYNSDSEEAPKTLGQLRNKVIEETEVKREPQTKEELQWAIYELEEKYRTICERYKMSFNFVDTQQYVLALEEVNWEWTKSKHPPG